MPGPRPIFVIHEHHASRLHWDLRLEMDGVLKSWAVPKEPSSDPSIKRLAVAVDDHDLSYAGFEGDIPEGQYGAGEVKIYDSGNYDLRERTESKIIFDLQGKRLNGIYCLIRLKDGKNWLFFRKK
jgi:DNA ligase D-like protein (predicted 3'-phosphoesterase)